MAELNPGGARVTRLPRHYITIRQTCNLTVAAAPITHLRIARIYNPPLTRLLYKLVRFILNFTFPYIFAKEIGFGMQFSPTTATFHGILSLL